ncbi:MAG TPA: hypothetical protein VJU86_12745 [Pyrinomonadaceae bacterium]|nr:hypothetical protein [Pyrinomonadaceae bacterium]
MSGIININAFRCTNHVPNHQVLGTGIFDIQNPCTWCGNRKHTGQVGSAFHYMEYGNWEFPFIAETNCKNFSILSLVGTEKIDPRAWQAAKEIHDRRNRIAEIGRRYSYHWLAYDEEYASKFTRSGWHKGDILYPTNMTPAEFFKEASLLRSDLFQLKSELGALTAKLRNQWNIRDSRIDEWAAVTSKQMGLLTKQIDELESKKHQSPLTVVSKWALRNVAGDVAWESLKWTSKIIYEMLKAK